MKTQNKLLKEQILEKQNIYKDKFYQKEKVYQAKPLMFNNEQKYFEWLKGFLQGSKYIAFPQISLRSIVKTPNTWKTSNELYKFIDFVIFKKENYMPLLAIEINGPTHETDPYQIARDESNKKILNDCEIPLIDIWEEEKIQFEDFINLIEEEINKIDHINQANEKKSLNYKKGQTVEHINYGTGKIIKISHDKLTAEVQFKNKKRNLMLEYAGLKILNNKET